MTFLGSFAAASCSLFETMLSKCLYEILFLPKGFLALVKHPAASIIIYIPIDFEQPLNFSLTDIGFLRNLNFASPSRLLDAPDAFIKRQILQIFLARNSLLETFNFVDRESPDVVTIPRQTMAKLRIIRFYGLSLAHRGWLLGDVKQQLWYIPVAFTISDLHHIPIRNPFAPANSQIQSQRIWRHHVNLRLSLNDVGIFLILLLTIFQSDMGRSSRNGSMNSSKFSKLSATTHLETFCAPLGNVR